MPSFRGCAASPTGFVPFWIAQDGGGSNLQMADYKGVIADLLTKRKKIDIELQRLAPLREEAKDLDELIAKLQKVETTTTPDRAAAARFEEAR